MQSRLWTRFGAALAVLACAALAALAVPSERAFACSCAPVDPAEALSGADAAFAGVLVSRRNVRAGPPVSSADPVELTFRVDRVLKGDLGTRVVVETAASGASCGIEADEGDRIALLLTRSGGGWRSNLCDQLAADDLPPLPAARVGGDDGRRPWATWVMGAATIVGLGAAALILRRRLRDPA